ncbi:PAS domain-containing sensor histidine kinase [Methanocella sp. MCL-LM]|uniref:PAS domain-containing sensor histidine kinase n=1 Tax=Methanocella sp. MCL-LM TaxID=3412035 RepID=UPI003C78EA8A
MTRNPPKSGPKHARKPAAEHSLEESAFEHTQIILANMLENFPGIVFWKDRNSVYLGCNRNFSTIAGFADPAEISGKSDYDMPWIKEQVDEYHADDRQVISSGKPRLNIVEMIHCADGKNRWFATNKVPLRDAEGRVIGVLGAGNDITEQKRAEEALKFEHDQLLSIFDSIDELIYVADPYTYEVLFANRWTRERFKKSIIGGKCFREFQDRASPCDFCTNAIILRDKGKPYYWEYHNPVINKDFWIVDRIIRWPDGRDARFEMAIDITERKQAISGIQDAKAKAELYLDLMSHDITNMNQALMGYLELIKATQKQESGEKELAERSIEIINRSSRMISNVKKLTEIEAQNVPLNRVNLCELLSEVVSEYSEVPDSKVTFNARLCPCCHVIAGDMLKDVFENLIDNAIRHSAGPVVVEIAVSRVALEGQEYYQIAISDNGPGIPDPLKKKIFMSAQEIRQKAERRGFGLYIVRTLVNYYHGKVWVENRVPDSHTKGSKFIVLLPCNL